MFPYVKDAPSLAPAPSLRATPSSGATSLRSAKPSWHRAARPNAQEARQRVLVFVAGGMTYSEMREAYSLSKSLNKEIILGAYPFPRTPKAHSPNFAHRFHAYGNAAGIRGRSEGARAWRCRIEGASQWRRRRPRTAAVPGLL